jgi:hypothetical protein
MNFKGNTNGLGVRGSQETLFRFLFELFLLLIFLSSYDSFYYPGP